MAKINETLKQLRLSRGLTQEEVAAQLNVTRQTVSGYESGRTQPGVDTLQRLAEIYDTELTDIIYGKVETGRLRTALKIFALVLAGLLLLTLLVEALALWIPNHFFQPVKDLSPEEVKALFSTRSKFGAVRDACTWIVSLLTTYGFTALLVLTLCQSRPLSVKTKLYFTFSLLLAAVVLILPWSLTDPLFSMQNYFYGAFLRLGWSLPLFLVLSLVIDGVRLYRRRRKAAAAQAASGNAPA